MTSLSARRAWIEIPSPGPAPWQSGVALRKESVDRNYNHAGKLFNLLKSLSARRAWIEMVDRLVYIGKAHTSLSARRAWIEIPVGVDAARVAGLVALRKESVDRNQRIKKQLIAYRVVALRKESVDRNRIGGDRQMAVYKVALRKESVDRNGFMHLVHIDARAVALRKESVDRNAERMKVGGIDVCRSPQGERG